MLSPVTLPLVVWLIVIISQVMAAVGAEHARRGHRRAQRAYFAATRRLDSVAAATTEPVEPGTVTHLPTGRDYYRAGRQDRPRHDLDYFEQTRRDRDVRDTTQ